MSKVIAIAATDDQLGIAKNGKIPWRVKEDMAWFKAVTTGNIVLMGSTTYFSFPRSVRPLPNRENWILSESHATKVWDDAKDAKDNRGNDVDLIISADLEWLREMHFLRSEILFICGGSSVYQQVMESASPPDEVWLSRIEGDFDCDQFFLEGETLEFFRQNYELLDEVQFNEFKLEKYYRTF